MSDREDIFHAIQKVLTGRSEADVLHVLLASLVVAIGVASDDLARAEMLIDALPTELKQVLRANWADYRKHRTRAEIVTPQVLQ